MEKNIRYENSIKYNKNIPVSIKFKLPLRGTKFDTFSSTSWYSNIL